MLRDDGRETSVKGNDDSGWSSDGVVLWLERRQNEDTIEWLGEWLSWDDLFIALESASRAVREGNLRWWCGFNPLVSAQEVRRRDKALSEDKAEAASSSWLNRKEAWHKMQRRDDVSQRRDGTGKGKGRRRCQLGWRESYGGQKIKKIHTVDSTGTNGRWRFKIALS
jgi:hypothetical protein